MIASNPDTTTANIVDLQIQLEVMKERDNHHLEKIAQLEQKLTEAQIEIDIRDNELKQAITQVNDQKVQLSSLKHKDETIHQLEQKLVSSQRTLDLQKSCFEITTKKLNEQKTQLAVYDERFKRLEQTNFNDTFISILASLLFFLSSGLASLGYNLVTSFPNTSPNSMGIVLISMAVAIFILATLMINFVRRGGKS